MPFGRAALLPACAVAVLSLTSCGSRVLPSSSAFEATAGLSPTPAATLSPTGTSPEPSAPGSSTYATAVAFWSDERGLAGLTISRPDGSSGELERTTDGGRSWATDGLTTSGVSEVAVAGSADAWALTGCQGEPSCVPRLYRSTDSGASWTSAVTDLTWISFVDPLDGWGVAGGRPSADPGIPALERTRDGGRRWATLASPCGGSDVGSLRAVAFRSLTSGLAVCAFTAGAGGELHAVFATDDGGRHWTARASTGGVRGSTPLGLLPYGGYIRGLVEARDGTTWMAGDRLAPLASRDGGVRWDPLGLGDSDANLVYAAWPHDARRGVAVMWAPESQATLFEVTSDGGRTWVKRSSWPVG